MAGISNITAIFGHFLRFLANLQRKQVKSIELAFQVSDGGRSLICAYHSAKYMGQCAYSCYIILASTTSGRKSTSPNSDGYKTKVISAAGGKWVDVNGDGRKEQFGYISLKHAAEIAGLGVIGKNYLLTNPQYGNLIWLSAILTNAELTPGHRQ